MLPRLLAIDYGRVRHGLAVSDALGLAAHPLPALQRSQPARDLAHLKRVIEERDVAEVIVGLPLHMSGDEGAMAVEVRRFGTALAEQLGLPVTYEDERLSTDEAETRLSARGLRPSERRKLRDSMAAAIILETVLTRRSGESD